MDFKDFTAGENDHNRRLDKVLRSFLDNERLTEIYKLIRKGLIKVNQKKSSPEYRVQKSDVISIAAFLFNDVHDELKTEAAVSLDKESIVFENKHLLIINKPYDINVHGNTNSLEKSVTAYYESKYEKDSLSFKPGPLHRLDRKTTGLLAFSFSLEGAQWFSENIKNHSIRKTYYALLQGNISKAEEWKDKITRNEQTKGFNTVTASTIDSNDEGKEAVSFVKPIDFGKYNGNDVTLVEIQILTGRKHQIRSQSALHKHPLLGDTAYGGIRIEKQKQDFYLQAFKLQLPDNNLGIPSEIVIPLNSSFEQILKYCHFKNIEL